MLERHVYNSDELINSSFLTDGGAAFLLNFWFSLNNKLFLLTQTIKGVELFKIGNCFQITASSQYNAVFIAIDVRRIESQPEESRQYRLWSIGDPYLRI